MPHTKSGKPKWSKRILDLIRDHGDKITDLLPFAHKSGRKGKRKAKSAGPAPLHRKIGARRRKPRSHRGKIPGNGGVSGPGVANFATPASFARVENNTTFLGPETPVTHPHLGIRGIRVAFSQPLTSIAPGYNTWTTPPGSGYANFFDTTDGPATSWPSLPTAGTPGWSQTGNYIDLNPGPAYLGGPLSTISQRYLKYRFVDLCFTYNTAVGTDQGGIFGLAVVDDPALVTVVGSSFNNIREVTPNVIAPYRIPEAALCWKNRNTTLYFVDNVDYVAPGNPGSQADGRQTINCTLVGFDSALLSKTSPTGLPASTSTIFTAGYVTVSGVCEFYEDIPPTNVPKTILEHRLVKEALRIARVREGVAQRPPPRGRLPDVSDGTEGAFSLRQVLEETQLRLRRLIAESGPDSYAGQASAAISHRESAPSSASVSRKA